MNIIINGQTIDSSTWERNQLNEKARLMGFIISISRRNQGFSFSDTKMGKFSHNAGVEGC